jgi:NAD(P)-dependent dehydrogenase (short-subunit alcohol dehydrogenase family)
MKHEIQAMTAQSARGGSIVNTASVNALGGVPHNSLYAMTKAGVVALTKSAALEYAKDNIRINALVAGAFRTPMLEGVIDSMAGGDPEQRARIEEKYASYIAPGRIGRPEEAAQVVVWLCSSAASYVTGQFDDCRWWDDRAVPMIVESVVWPPLLTPSSLARSPGGVSQIAAISGGSIPS